MKSRSFWRWLVFSKPGQFLFALAIVLLVILTSWASLVYAHEERFCRTVPLSYAAGRVKAAKAISSKIPTSMEEAVHALAGRVSESMLSREREVKSEHLSADEGGFTLTITTDCLFFRRSSKRFDWTEDAFSKVILNSSNNGGQQP